MEGPRRSGSSGRRLLTLCALVAAVSLLAFCARDSGTRAERETLPDTLPIPAPPRAFGGTATAAEYLAYARTLEFATADSTSAITRHVTDTSVSRLRMSPEVRLLTTPDSAFFTGRVIARLQTDSGVSPYRTPIGQAFMWVWRTAEDRYQALIVTDSSAAGPPTIYPVRSFYHVPLPPSVRMNTFCEPLDSVVAGNCCRCASGCWNPFSNDESFARVQALVRAKYAG
ncbi:MAG: hypothetical protein ACT4R6_13555 [Gemmatimonadaceae bacterium]